MYQYNKLNFKSFKCVFFISFVLKNIIKCTKHDKKQQLTKHTGEELKQNNN